MTIRKLLAALFIVSFGAMPVVAQTCPHNRDTRPAYEVTVVTPGISYPLSVNGNPCAPYGWCGARDAWGNPVYVQPSYNAYPDMSAYGAATVILEATRPSVNGWTGAVETRAYSPYDFLVAY